MPTKTKIKIDDLPELRSELDAIYEKKSQKELAQWALKLADRILMLVNYDYEADVVVQNGFCVNTSWQSGNASVLDVREAGFQIHRCAKECSNPLVQAALRVAGHAVSSGHVSEHAMVASDYAIKVVNMKFPHDAAAVKAEREWQINALQE